MFSSFLEAQLNIIRMQQNRIPKRKRTALTILPDETNLQEALDNQPPGDPCSSSQPSKRQRVADEHTGVFE